MGYKDRADRTAIYFMYSVYALFPNFIFTQGRFRPMQAPAVQSVPPIPITENTGKQSASSVAMAPTRLVLALLVAAPLVSTILTLTSKFLTTQSLSTQQGERQY